MPGMAVSDLTSLREEINRLRQTVSRAVRESHLARTAMARMLTGPDRPTCRLQQGTVNAILLGGYQDVTITWVKPMPTATYEVELIGMVGLIGRGTMTVQSQTAAGIVVRVTAGLAVALGSQFLAHARS